MPKKQIIKGVLYSAPFSYALASAKLGAIPDGGKLYFGGSIMETKNGMCMCNREAVLVLYNTCMNIVNNVYTKQQPLTQQDKSFIMDGIGALMSAVYGTKFLGTYSLEELKEDIKNI